MIRSKIIIKVKIFFLLSFSFFLVSCSSPTETPKGSLSGTVNLEGETDHSNIIVALYDLTTLDPDIVSINQEYPHIGVIINQHTEFDHRLQEPVKYTETDAEGYFEIKKIPTGTYNIVALKDNFGFKYIYEFEIEKGDNELTPQPPLFNPIEGKTKSNRLSEKLLQGQTTKNLIGKKTTASKNFRSSSLVFDLENRPSDLTLFPETHISGNISGSVTVETNHHLVIDDDTVFVPNTSTLIIQPGAVIRINPGVDLTIHGTLTAQGEENNMFWVTTNAGFALNDSSFNFQFSIFNFQFDRSEELLLYNSMELSSFASISDDLIEWGKFDYANTCLINYVNNLHMQNGIFRNANCGFKSTNVNSTFCEKLIAENCYGESEGAIYGYFVNNIEISLSIFIANVNGIKLKDEVIGDINNCYFNNNVFSGIRLFDFSGDIINCEFECNLYDIGYNGSRYYDDGVMRILRNIFYSENAIKYIGENEYSKLDSLIIQYNNFYSNELFVSYNGRDGFLNYFNCDMNYFNGLTEFDDVMELFYDEWDELYEILPSLNNIYPNPINEAGIQ